MHETQDRLVSLDVFRGITIAGMVLVNNPGTWSAVYSPLEHAEWNGWTPTDLVFPFFLFIVGVAITISLGKRVEANGINRSVYLRIIRRSIVIFVIGLFLATFPFYNFAKGEWLDPSHFRILGVLQRIAICYFIGALIFLHTNWKQQAVIAVGLLLLYWALMTLIDVPGCAVTTFNDKACNLAAYIDRTVLGETHLWSQARVYDPEGLLSTIPAIVTTIAGLLTGKWLRSNCAEARGSARAKSDDETDSTARPILRPEYETVSGIFVFGILLVAIGWIWSFWFPINKALWTSSYVLFTAGMALCFFGFCYWLIDIKGFKSWTKPFVIFGVNAIALYAGSDLMVVFMDLIQVSGPDGRPISLQEWIFNNAFLRFAEPINASLAYAVCFILVWLFLMWLLYRKRIYLRV